MKNIVVQRLFEEISENFLQQNASVRQKMSKVPKKLPNLFVTMLFLSSWLRVLKMLQKKNIRCTGGCFEEINALFWKSHNFESTTLG